MAAAASPLREPATVWLFILLFTALFAIYLVSCYLMLRGADALPLRPTLALVAVVAVAARGILVFSPPTLSDDMYRYIWDGRVMSTGLSPYAYSPGDPAVEGLRLPNDTIWERINRKDAITIYPPGAELFYAGVYRLYPDSVAWTKGAMVLVDLASCALLLLILGCLGMPLTRVILYAWAPLPIVEFGGSGHVEALSVFWTLSAILAGVIAVQWAQAGQVSSGRDVSPSHSGSKVEGPKSKVDAGYAEPWTMDLGPSPWVGVSLAAAALVKLIPLLLLAGFVRRFGWRIAALCLGLFGAVYALFVVAAGGYVSSFLVTYLRYEHNNAPLYAFLSGVVANPFGISDDFVRGGLLLALGGVALLVALKRDTGPYSFITKSFVLVAAYLLLATNAHPWYATWLLLFLPLVLPPGGLLLSGNPDRAGGTWLRRDYGLALVALLYTGLTFWGYSFFALEEVLRS
jgi:hypothetical protein